MTTPILAFMGLPGGAEWIKDVKSVDEPAKDDEASKQDQPKA